MNTKTAVVICVLLAVASVAYVVGMGAKNMSGPLQVQDENPVPSNTTLYVNEQARIAFRHPKNYVAQERVINSAQRYHAVVTLYDRDIYESMQRSEMTEGPTAITFDIYQNDLDKQSVENWVTGTSDSNYKLSPDGALVQTTVGGESGTTEGLMYSWSGLYNGDTVAFAHNGNIIAASVTYDSPDDQIRRDFQNVVMPSLELLGPPVAE